MKLNTRHSYLKNKGFTLIELILAVGISSMIILSLYSILDLSFKSYSTAQEKDELLLNARYGVEYIKNEIKNADLIISNEKIINLNSKFPSNIGFVILTIEEETINGLISYRYNFVTYFTENGILKRIAYNDIEKDYPHANDLKGYNEISTLVAGIGNTKCDWENKIINLDFTFASSAESDLKLDIRSDIFIRCDIDY